MTDLKQTATVRDKIEGCWLGKAVGGTLGQTFEGLTGPLNADYYHPVPEEMVPNDDLDLQVLYACVLSEQQTPVVDRHVLAEAWRDHVEFPWNEYGVGMRNLAEGLQPPHTGSFDNWFTAGEGAAIRSELWACLAPGNPDLAAAYAYEDACFDHAGDGIYAAQFLARLQSLAFIESDPDTLIDGALAGIPADSGITSVVTDTRRWVRENTDWHAVRELIMAAYGSDDFTDVRPNTGFVILGWLMGSTFSERICITNNCGEDCDSSTASIGALLGILDPSSIEDKWLTPIGNDLVLNKEITGITPPETLNGFTDLVLDLQRRLNSEGPAAVSEAFDAGAHGIAVQIAHFSTEWGSWADRDNSELPPVGSTPPKLEFLPAQLPGTWVRMPSTSFESRLLMLHYRMDARGRDQVRLMLNSTEDYRIWLDGDYLHGAQGSNSMFPAPHMAPVGQFIDFTISAGVHDLLVAIKKPPAGRDVAEWVLALVEMPSTLWIENAFRP
ncbi:ADP-ribosylglycohydrolase family protein [Subtercola boreus]|nr:ADP-ribosylglycohydrolase family protein [Subtercola boreus]